MSQASGVSHHMHLPRRAIGHVLKTPVAHPEDAARVFSVDSTREEVHRASMSNDIFAFPVREWVRGEVPAGRRCEDLLVPKARKLPRDRDEAVRLEGPTKLSPGFDLPRPKVDLVKVPPR
jgi:hypothetical protein